MTRQTKDDLLKEAEEQKAQVKDLLEAICYCCSIEQIAQITAYAMSRRTARDQINEA